MSNFTLGISTTFLKKSVKDGIAHYTEQLLHELIAQGLPCKGFYFKPKNSKQEPSSFLSDDSPLPHAYEHYLLKSVLTCGKILSFNPKVDLFHSTDHQLMPMKCKVVATFYDAIPLVHPEWIAGGTLRQHAACYFFKRNIQFADHVLTISHHSAKDILRYFNIRDKNISVIPIAVDNAWFNPVAEQHYQQILQQYSLKAGYFLSVGTLQPRKNYERLIDAYLSLAAPIRDERKLVIVGKQGHYSAALVAKIKKLQMEGQLLWLSDVNSDADMRCIYKGAGALVFPSLYEGFGLPVLEAFACGLPVICSNTTSLPEVSAGAALEVNPESVGEIAEAMQLFATNAQERTERVRLGHARAAQFSWTDTARKTIQVYEDVLKIR